MLYLQPRGLERIQGTEAQFCLSASEREKNLAMAFVGWISPPPPASSVLLLDDVCTTGATARSAVQTLRQFGIQVYWLRSPLVRGKPKPKLS